MTGSSLAALVFVILSSRSAQEINLDSLAAELATRDVVFLGEEHDNTVGHKLQLAIIKALHRIRPDLVISMEQFERDAQGTLNDYLAGRIDEAAFLKHSRPWPNYKQHYRPIIEYAKASGLEVIAANVPRPLAHRVSTDGLPAVAEESFAARVVSAPHDRYFKLFTKSMSEHPGSGIKGTVLDRWYASQCLKDDTMAESIHDFRRGHPTRHPLIVHLCGTFHSDFGLGTVQRLLQRDPLCQVAVLSMASAKDPKTFDAQEDLQRAHYLLVVPEEPKKEKQEKQSPKTDKPAVNVAAAKDTRSANASGDDEADEADEEGEGGGRAALGLMPSYDDDDDSGVLVDGISEGKGAEKAGIKEGDRIIALGGTSIIDLNDYMDIMSDFHPGQTIKVKVKRKGKELEFKVKLGVYGG